MGNRAVSSLPESVFRNLAPQSSLQAVNLMLVDIAAKIQLTKSEHDLAVDRAKTIFDWMQRVGSPLRGRIEEYYPQGSMAVGATIDAQYRAAGKSEKDIDVVAHVDPGKPVTPKELLKMVEDGLTGDRYAGKIERKNRCVRVQYDEMHLDITPALRVSRNEKEIQIPHWDEKTGEQYWVDANPWGFARWFNDRMPKQDSFAMDYALRAQVEAAPEYNEFYRKPKALVSLQLIKRWRNQKYDRRNGRIPPSIMLSKLIADVAAPRSGTFLFDELRFQVHHLYQQFHAAHAQGNLIDVRNPVYPIDRYTDRWPVTLQVQKIFVDDLIEFAGDLQRLSGDSDLKAKKTILEKLFGESVASYAVQKLAETLANKNTTGGLMHETRGGRPSLSIAGTGGIIPVKAGLSTTAQNTHFGMRPEDDE